MLIVEFIFKHFWIMFIVTTLINAVIYKFRFKQYYETNPELEDGYKKIIKAFMIYGNIPWIIMGLGMLVGSTSSIFDYFNPRGLNPFVLLFHIALIYIYIITIKYVYFNGGAEFLEKHPGLFERASWDGKKKYESATSIKIWLGLMLLGGILGMTAMWCVYIPTPPFK